MGKHSGKGSPPTAQEQTDGEHDAATIGRMARAGSPDASIVATSAAVITDRANRRAEGGDQ